MPEVVEIAPETSKKRVNYWIGALLVFIGAVCFSAKAVLIKIAFQNYHIDSVSLLALRMLFAFPAYAIVAFSLSRKDNYVKLKSKEWMWLAVLGIIGYYLASIFDFEGLQYVSASVERLILFVYPTLVVILSALIFKKKISKIQYAALVLTYSGMLVAFSADVNAGVQQNLITGGIWIFMSAFTYSLYMIGSGELIPKVGSLRFTSFAMMFATLAIIINFLLVRGVNIFHFPAEIYWIALAMAIFSTVIPTFLVSEGINLVGSGNASIIGGIGPFSTILLANIFLDEKISFFQVFGTLIVLAGVIMIGWKGKK